MFGKVMQRKLQSEAFRASLIFWSKFLDDEHLYAVKHSNLLSPHRAIQNVGHI